MPLACGYLGDGSGGIEASAKQQPPAAGKRDVGSGCGRAVGRLEYRAQAALAAGGDGFGTGSHRQPGGVCKGTNQNTA